MAYLRSSSSFGLREVLAYECLYPDCVQLPSEKFVTELCDKHLARAFATVLDGMSKMDEAEKAEFVSMESPLPTDANNMASPCPVCGFPRSIWRTNDGHVYCAADGCDYRISEEGWRAADTARLVGESDGRTVVYYIRFSDRIKIGFTTNLSMRLQNIPYDWVEAIEFGGSTLERQRHVEFANLRIKGEWFQASPPLLKHAYALRRAS